MTIPEEIEELKKKLEQTTGEHEQAEIILEILKKYVSIRSTDSQLYIDLLLQLAETTNTPLYRAEGLYYCAQSHRLKAEHEEALLLSEQALALFEKLNNKKGIASVYTNIGNTHWDQGNYPEALKNHFASLKTYKESVSKSGMASAYKNIGVIYRDKGNYPEALKNYFTALAIFKESGDKLNIARCYSLMGTIYALQGNYPEALKNYFAALKISEEIGDRGSMANAYINIGNIRSEQGDIPEALKNYFACLEIYNEIGNKSGMAMCYANIGEIYEKQGNYSEALKNQLGALATFEEIGDKMALATTYFNIGNIYVHQGNYSEALKEQLKASQLAQEIGYKKVIKDSSVSLTKVYKANNDFENALKHYEKFHEVEKEMLGEESTKQLNNLSFTHNLEQKEKDLEIEQLRNVELKKERDRSENLLLNILPAEVAEELKNKGSADAKLFDDVTVLFTDFKSFTQVSERLTPQQLVDELNVCFSVFDGIMAKYNIEKIKTVGDAYLAVSGLPLATPNHAIDVINASIEIRDFIKQRRTEKGDDTFDIRIGVHSGSVVAGIVGVKKFAYDIWGDTVNTAARMEQNSEAGKINISQTTFELVKDKFNCEYRGEIEAKNKGKLKMYFVE